MTYYEIPISAQPAQRFSFIMGDYEYVIRLKTSRDIISGADVSYHGELYMDLSVNGAVIFQGLRCDSASDFLELFAYREIPGRLFFITRDNLPPSWERLGVEDKLYYALQTTL